MADNNGLKFMDVAGPIGNLIGSGINAISQSSMNKKTRKWNEKMMQLQRQWSLQDWERQNQYNSPAQQMQRLREANLNPHLIYGSNSAVQRAADIGVPSPGNWNPKAPALGAILTNPVNAYMETRSFTAQQKMLDAQTLKTLTEIDKNKLSAASMEMANKWQESIIRENLTGKMISNKFEMDENARRELTTASNLSEAVQRIAKSKSDIDLQQMMRQKGNEEIKSIKQMRQKVASEISNLNMDYKLKEFEKKLNDAGFTKSDPYYFRIGKTIADLIGLDTESVKTGINNLIEEGKKTGAKVGMSWAAFEALLNKILSLR